MRWFASVCAASFCAPLSGAAPAALEVVLPIVSQSDGGAPMPAGFAHVPGETLFFSFQVAGFTRSAEDKVDIDYTVDALDPRGVRVMETAAKRVSAELSPQDKEWRPRVRLEISLPSLADSGTYKIVIKVTDAAAKVSAEKTVAFEVSGHVVAPSETLTVRNFRFFRGEEDQEALAKAVYRPGDPVWARFDIAGFKYGGRNAIDVVYGLAVLDAAGKQLWSQAEAAVERSESFYPKRYLPGAMSINLQSSIRPGEYTIALQVKDAVGKQEYEAKFNFIVEP
jgi:hypothetical protein